MKTDWNIMLGIKEIFENIIEAAKTPMGWLAAVLTFFAPLKDVYVLLLIIVGFDFVTGVMASVKRKVPRSSSRFKNSVIKMFCYFGAVFIFWQFEERLDLEYIHGSYKLIAGFIAFVETISILENMAVITANKIFLKIVRLIRGKAAEKGGSLIDDILNEKNPDKEKEDKKK